MNMALSGIHRFIFTVIYISAGFAKAFVKLDCKTENLGQHGQKSLLDCVIKVTQEMDCQIRAIAWRREGEENLLLSFYGGKTENQEGYSFAEWSRNSRNMNVSLLITNTALKDNGVYECEVVTSRGEAKVETSLKVTAKYSTPTINSIPEVISQTKEGTLVCESKGGYPKGKIYWYGEQGDDWTKSAELEVKWTEDGLFQLTSRLSLLPGSIFPKYTCVVFNAFGGKEEEATVEIPPRPEAKYSTPTIYSIPKEISLTKEGTLVCKSKGGYPKGKISWYGEQGEDWTKSAELEVKRTEDGLFQLTSRLSLLPGSIFPKYTCVVFNAFGGKDEEATFEIPPGPEGVGDDLSVLVFKAIAPVVVIGSLIVGLLLALLIYRRRSRQARRPSTAPLMDYHEEVRSHEQDFGEGDNQEKKSTHGTHGMRHSM